jgi:hypothetical protein
MQRNSLSNEVARSLPQSPLFKEIEESFSVQAVMLESRIETNEKYRKWYHFV